MGLGDATAPATEEPAAGPADLTDDEAYDADGDAREGEARVSARRSRRAPKRKSFGQDFVTLFRQAGRL